MDLAFVVLLDPISRGLAAALIDEIGDTRVGPTTKTRRARLSEDKLTQRSREIQLDLLRLDASSALVTRALDALKR